MPYKIGDRVLCVEEYDGNKRIVGVTGTIRELDTEWAAVEYDEDVGGHDLDDRCQYGYGWNTDYSCLELFEEPEFPSEVLIPYEELNI